MRRQVGDDRLVVPDRLPGRRDCPKTPEIADNLSHGLGAYLIKPQEVCGG